jgi:hypothetical protein
MVNGKRYPSEKGALEARDIPAGDGRLQADAVGEVELDGKVLAVRRIHLDQPPAAADA